MYSLVGQNRIKLKHCEPPSVHEIAFERCGLLPANASRAFLMSSPLRMLFIAILAVRETNGETKEKFQ